MFGMTVFWKHTIHSVQKTHWHCRDEEVAIQALRNLDVPADATFAECVANFKRFCYDIQEQHGCQMSNRERSHKRLPMQILDMYNRVQRCADESDKQILKKLAWEARKRWFESQKLKVLCSRIKKGGVVQKSKKLHVITSVHVDGIETAGQVGAQAVCADFECKWACGKMSKFELINDFLISCHGPALKITPKELERVLENWITEALA